MTNSKNEFFLRMLAFATTLVASLAYIEFKPKYTKNKILIPLYDYCGLIGNTPILSLASLSHLVTNSIANNRSSRGAAAPFVKVEILAKLEYNNPSRTCKDRVALGMVSSALARISVSSPPSKVTIVEGSSGSTGISLASIIKTMQKSTPFELSFTCVCPSDMSSQKKEMIDRLGGGVVSVEPASISSEQHYVNTARRLADEINNNGDLSHLAIFINQFENQDNPNVHYTTTGPEIITQLERADVKLDAFVVGAGTGGTITGCGRALKEHYCHHVEVVLADPQASVLCNKVRHGIAYVDEVSEQLIRRHRVDTIVEGIGLERVCGVFSSGLEVVDSAEIVTDQEVIFMAGGLLETEGVFVGGSTSVNFVASVRVAKRLALEKLRAGKGGTVTVLTTICDGGERHLSRMWNREFVTNERKLIFTDENFDFGTFVANL